jgi:hypothetical protein
MPTIRFSVETTLVPTAVLAGLTDFGASRAEVWPNVDSEHFKLHEQGPGWADVTEGNSVAGGVWERERYTWDVAAHTVAIETTDSNTWGNGSRWDYRLVPTTAGTRVEVTVVRNPIGLKGRLIALALTVAGTKMLRTQMEQALARISARSADSQVTE